MKCTDCLRDIVGDCGPVARCKVGRTEYETGNAENCPQVLPAIDPGEKVKCRDAKFDEPEKAPHGWHVADLYSGALFPVESKKAGIELMNQKCDDLQEKYGAATPEDLDGYAVVFVHAFRR